MPMSSTSGNAYTGPNISVSVGASPFSWTNDQSVPVLVFLGGTLPTANEASPDGGVTFLPCTLGNGPFWLNPGWLIRITYVVIAPTMQYTAV